MDYPVVGQDISAVVQEILNCQGDPKRNGNATNGPVTFRVFAAKVVKADDVVPSRDGNFSSALFQGHIEMSLPNGQTVKCENYEKLVGIWKNGRITALGLNSVYGGAFDSGSGGDLVEMQPPYLRAFRLCISANSANTGAFVADLCSIETIFWKLRGHDLVHQQYDFSTWLEGNRLAMAHTALMFGAPPAASPTPPVVSQVPAAAPTTPAKEVFDRYRLFPAPGVCFAIPMSSPDWLRYKNALFTPRFDPQGWAALAATLPRPLLEQRMHDSLLASLHEAQRKASAKHGPYISRVAQAAYIAQQPGATQAEKDTYQKLSRGEEAELGASTSHLMALKILVDAIQDDIDTQQK
jgi:hypothetical protein